jgi:DNA mismatch endonuclease (patch repair protein)
MDVLSKELRRKTMAAVKSKDSKCEMIVRKMLHANGFRYRLHDSTLPGTPDLIFPRYKTVVFVHGCFWHQHQGCSAAARPVSRMEYWDAKLDRNVARDTTNVVRLQAMGWKVLVVWECETRNRELLLTRLKREIVQ